MRSAALRDTAARLRRLSEADEPKPASGKTPDDAVEEAGASIDGQVRKFLVSALSEAGLAKTEGRDFRALTRRLLEAEEDEKGEEPDPVATDKKTLEEIDVASYAEAVSRLVDNFDALIEINGAVVTAAKVMLKKDFDDSVVEAFEDLLAEEYDLGVGRSKWDKDEDLENQPPPARNAGPSV